MGGRTDRLDADYYTREEAVAAAEAVLIASGVGCDRSDAGLNSAYGGMVTWREPENGKIARVYYIAGAFPIDVLRPFDDNEEVVADVRRREAYAEAMRPIDERREVDESIVDARRARRAERNRLLDENEARRPSIPPSVCPDCGRLHPHGKTCDNCGLQQFCGCECKVRR